MAFNRCSLAAGSEVSTLLVLAVGAFLAAVSFADSPIPMTFSLDFLLRTISKVTTPAKTIATTTIAITIMSFVAGSELALLPTFAVSEAKPLSPLLSVAVTVMYKCPLDYNYEFAGMSHLK